MKLYFIIIIITQRVLSDSVTGTASLTPISRHPASTASSPTVKPTGGLCYLFFSAFPHMWQWNIFRMANRNYHWWELPQVYNGALCQERSICGPEREYLVCCSKVSLEVRQCTAKCLRRRDAAHQALCTDWVCLLELWTAREQAAQAFPNFLWHEATTAFIWV